MRLLFASLNKGKSIELMELAQKYSNLTLVLPDEVSGEPPLVEENAVDYRGNAMLKAAAFRSWSGLATLADDTGLEVEALSGAPGVRSARYAGEPSDPRRNIEKLLSELRGSSNRRARFVCVLVALLKDNQILEAEAVLPGEIIDNARGTGGFGYDSIFVPDGYKATLAELKAEGAKIETHRILAAQKLFGIISDLT